MKPTPPRVNEFSWGPVLFLNPEQVAEMQRQALIEGLRYLEDRLETAHTRLQDLAMNSPDSGLRITGKAEGVNLALSYIEEMLR